MDTSDTSATSKETNGHLGRKLQAEFSKSHENLPNSVEGPTKQEHSESNVKTTVDDDSVEYPHGLRLAIITVVLPFLVRSTPLTLCEQTALCLSVLCFSLDNTIIATAIPRITDEFKALDDVGWYASAYLLAGCAPQLIYGKLYTFYDTKWVYLTALFIFELGSLVCGVAPNSTALIIGRAIAGLGGAGIFTGAMLIISKTVPLRLRPTYTSLIGAVFGVSSVVAPLIGGAFTDKSTWRWCFYLNLPIGGVTMFFIVFFYKSPGRTVTNMVAKVRAFRLDNLKFFNFAALIAIPNNSTNMDDLVTLPMLARKPGEEIKTKYKEAMR